ncbi:GNAT family N-acetyltransferase [Priestia aryabhattai]|uniref:GNAT family N-acetyltransferase n=1 Tax=Priestia megaterium TaxID=1404 RepID=UPI003F9D6DBB
MDIQIKKGNINDVELITNMVANLLTELGDININNKELVDICSKLLNNQKNLYTAFLAYRDTQCIGVITLSEFISLYGKGLCGLILELYIVPSERSKGIGGKLIHTVKEYGFQRGWSRVEVGAPDPEKWNKTVSFYKREGFQEVGPRLKYHLK